jgi:hypothetical protein
VLQLFEEYLEPHSTLYSLAKKLSDLGIPTPSGKPRWNVVKRGRGSTQKRDSRSPFFSQLESPVAFLKVTYWRR